MKKQQQLGVFLLIAVYLPISLSEFVKTDQTQIISILNESCYAAVDQNYGNNELESVETRIEEIKELFPASNIILNNIRVVKSTDLYSIFAHDLKKQSYLAIRGTKLHVKDFRNETLIGLDKIPYRMNAIHSAMNNEMKDFAMQGYTINVSGHSMGANLALQACADNSWVNHCEVHNPFLNDKLVEIFNSTFISRGMNTKIFIQETLGDWASQLFPSQLMNVTYSVFNQVSSVQGLTNHSSLTLFAKAILEGNQYWNFNDTLFSKPLTKQDEINIGAQYFEYSEAIFNTTKCASSKQYYNFNVRACIDCPQGLTCADRFLGPSYCSSTEYLVQGKCLICPGGQYGEGVGENKCQYCPSGSKCNNGIKEFCDPGTFSSQLGLQSCKECYEGYYSLSYGATSCEQCPLGYQCPNKSGYPIPCQPGTFNNNRQIQCIDCQNGYYSTHSRAIRCEACPFGHYCPTKSGNPIPCEQGTYNNYTGQTQCSKCSLGQYQTKSGSNRCEICPSGHYCPIASENAIPCQPGTYSNSEQSVCKECSKGFYSSSYGATSCIACPPGYQCPIKSENPIPCQPGTYTFSSEQIQCIECSQGNYQPNSGASSCIKCPPGTFQNEKGQSSCKVKSNFLSY